MAYHRERDDGQDGRSQSQSSDSQTAPAARRAAQWKTSAQARATSQPYSLADERKPMRPSDLLSCSECRKRKTKCDRQTPCSGCIQRGKPDLCNPDIRRYPPAAGKLSEELADLRDHVQRLESFLATKYPEYASQFVENPNDALASLSSAQITGTALGNDNAVDDIHDSPHNIPIPVPYDLFNESGKALPPHASTVMTQPLSDNNSRTDRNDQSMASILARFRDSEILGADKEPSCSEISPASGHSSLHAQLFPSEAASWPSIRMQNRPGSPRMRMQLFATNLLSQIPSSTYCYQHVEAYFRHTSWEIFAVGRKQLLSELSEFEALRLQGEASETDPAWLAILLIVISMGLLTTYHSPRSSWEEEADIDYRRASAHYAELSKAALELADWTASPSIRVLQAVLVTGWRYHHLDARNSAFDGRGRPSLAYKTLLHVAYEHCCALNITTLQVDSDATIAPDYVALNASPSMRRQFGLRLWFTYLVVETLLSDHQVDREQSSMDIVLPGMYTEEDLASPVDLPERSVTEHSNLLYLHLQKIIFGQLWRQFQLARRAAPLSEINPTIQVYRDELDRFLVDLASVKSIPVPSPLGTYQGLINAIQLFKASAALRVYRPMLLSMNFAYDSDLVKNATAEAAAVAAISVLPDTKTIMLCFPPAVNFLYNAATLLLVTLCPETDNDLASERSALLQSSLRLLQSVQAETKSAAIANNAKKMYDALIKLGRALLQESQNLPFIARQRLETILAPQGRSWDGSILGQPNLPLSNNLEFTFSSAQWDTTNHMDQATLTPAIWPDSLISDPMAMTTDIDGWLKWLDTV